MRAAVVGLLALLCSLMTACAPSERASQAPAAPEVSSPPNIIFIMADDLGYGDLGAYGQEKIQTPNLDRMARQGTVFESYYAGSTVCAPSRWTLFTGRHTGHTYVRGNVALSPRGDLPLRAQDTTLTEVFDEAGYTTGVYGKWALGLKGTSGAPHRQGVDDFFGYEDQSEAHHYYVDRLQGIEHGVTVNVNVDTTQYTHDLFAEAALQFIETHRQEPFFLYLPFTIPHADIAVPESALQAYLDAEGASIFPETPYTDPQGYRPQLRPYAAYAAMVSRLDRDVGRILDKLRALGLAENTYVFFTSDNGPHAEGGYEPSFFNSNGPLRGMKRDLYEGGIRVPMLAWAPGRIPAGRRSDQLWAHWDVLPTLADLAGLEAPTARIDGRSMANTLTGTGPQQDHAYLYWEFLRGGRLRQAVRLGRWKALRSLGTGEESTIELYDLKRDLDESNNVAVEYPEVVEQMRAAMEQAHTTPVREEFRMRPSN